MAGTLFRRTGPLSLFGGRFYSCCIDMSSVLAARFTQLVVDEEAGGSESHSDAAAWTARADAILKAAAKKGGNSFYISNH